MLPDKALLAREERLRDEFDRRASAVPDPQETYLRRIAEQAIASNGFAADERVLDVGCGDGWLCRLLSPLCPEGALVGIDISGELIHSAREHSLDCDNVLHTIGSAEEIPWAEDYFTRVLSVETAYYWSSPERAAAEMFRVAAWGGRADLLVSFCTENRATHHWQDLVPEPLLLQDAAAWRELLALAGFQNVEESWVSAQAIPSAEFQPGSLWKSHGEWESFNETGALLISGYKPQIPPPGPLASEPEPPDPLRIIR